MRPNGLLALKIEQPPKTAKQLSPEEVAAAAARYKAGDLLREIAKDLGVHRVTLGSRLTQAGVEIRNKGMSEQSVDEAARRYESGESLARIGEALGFSARTVRSYLLERGVRIRSTTGR